MSEMIVYEAAGAVARTSGQNYKVTAPFTGNQVTLERDVDFGVIPGTKQPSLMKSGAQKIANAFGLLQHFTVESAIEDVDKPLFFYRVRCDLVKIAQDGTEYIFTSGHGSSNTSERRNGRSSPFDSANATLKMAEKRALVAAALSISGLSTMFTQDMENENFMSQANEVLQSNPNEPISANQLKRLFAIAGNRGYSTAQAKKILAEHGIASAKTILKKDYDTICEIFNSGDDNE